MGFHSRLAVRSIAVSAVLMFFMTFIPSNASALTIEEEREMGREVLVQVKKHMDVVQDPAINDYVSSLGSKILDAIGPQPFDYHFYVIDYEVINAFAVPAGYIFINSEVIMSMENEGQLASIIAHEIAHVTSRHIAERIAKSRNINLATLAGVLAGAIIGGPAGTALMMGSVGGGIQAQLANSREDEREADRRGLDYLTKAGYNPVCMAEAFDIMLRNSYHVPEGFPSYLTTHPGLTERIAKVQNAVISHPAYKKKLSKGDQKAFAAIQDRVMAMLADTTRARNHFQDKLAKDPNDANAHYGLAIIYQKQQNYDQALESFKRAMKIQPANPVFLTDLGELYILNKDFTNAMNVLSKAVVLRPDYPRALYLLAQTYQDKGVDGRALELYEKVLKINPDHVEALSRSGVLYGRRGDLARAHLNTGLYFKAEGEIAKAVFHFKEAKKYYNTAPITVRDRIDLELKETEKAAKKLPPENQRKTRR